MSGTPDFDARSDSMMWKADSFLAKPFPMALLRDHLNRWLTRIQAERNPFSQLAAGIVQTVETVNRAYVRAVVERIGSALQAAQSSAWSRQTVASSLTDATRITWKAHIRRQNDSILRPARKTSFPRSAKHYSRSCERPRHRWRRDMGICRKPSSPKGLARLAFELGDWHNVYHSYRDLDIRWCNA